MLVFSQDRKKIIKCKYLTVSKNFGGKKDEKYSIIGSAGFGTELGESSVVASFPDEKSAMDELEKVYNAFAQGAASYKF